MLGYAYILTSEEFFGKVGTSFKKTHVRRRIVSGVGNPLRACGACSGRLSALVSFDPISQDLWRPAETRLLFTACLKGRSEKGATHMPPRNQDRDKWSFLEALAAGLRQQPAYLLIFAISALFFLLSLGSGVSAAVQELAATVPGLRWPSRQLDRGGDRGTERTAADWPAPILGSGSG